jgi:pimeloyl-ACP methyl ester carboxylesterase
MEALPAQPYAPWYRQSAQTVMSRANVLSHLFTAEAGDPALAAIHAPALGLFGRRDLGGEAELATARRNASTAPRVDTELIGDADHVYALREPEVARVIAR